MSGVSNVTFTQNVLQILQGNNGLKNDDKSIRLSDSKNLHIHEGGSFSRFGEVAKIDRVSSDAQASA